MHIHIQEVRPRAGKRRNWSEEEVRQFCLEFIILVDLVLSALGAVRGCFYLLKQKVLQTD